MSAAAAGRAQQLDHPQEKEHRPPEEHMFLRPPGHRKDPICKTNKLLQRDGLRHSIRLRR